VIFSQTEAVFSAASDVTSSGHVERRRRAQRSGGARVSSIIKLLKR